MNNKMIKYKDKNLWHFFYSIKYILLKNKIEEKESIKETVKEQKKTTNVKQKFAELVSKFDKRELEEKYLSVEEKNLLIKYYENKNQELDKKIGMKKIELDNLNKRLNRAYEKAIMLGGDING